MREFDVRDYGAAEDRVSTREIQAAIDAAAGAGGTAVVRGRYTTGTLFLRSGSCLRIERGGAILGSGNPEDFPELSKPSGRFPIGRWTGVYDRPLRALFCAMNEENICVCGAGEIDGQCEPAAAEPFVDAAKWNFKPYNLLFLECRNVVVEGLRILRARNYNLRLDRCEEVRCEGLRVESRGIPCGDGIDFFGGRRLLVKGCSFETGDDCVCAKPLTPRDAVEDLEVEDCDFFTDFAAVRLGPEATAPVRNVRVHDCRFSNCADGIKVQSDTGSVMEDLEFRNLEMRHVNVPLFVTANCYTFDIEGHCRPKGASVRNLRFENVRVDNGEECESEVRPYYSGIYVSGSPDASVSGVTLKNLSLRFAGGDPGGESAAEVAEMIESMHNYFELDLLKRRGLPGWAAFLRRIEGLTLEGVSLSVVRPDARLPMVLHAVEGAKFRRLSAPAPFVKCFGCSELSFSECPGAAEPARAERKAYSDFRRLTAELNAQFEWEAEQVERMRRSCGRFEEFRASEPEVCLGENEEKRIRMTLRLPRACDGFDYLFLPWFYGNLRVICGGREIRRREVPECYLWTAYAAVPLPEGSEEVELEFWGRDTVWHPVGLQRPALIGRP